MPFFILLIVVLSISPEIAAQTLRIGIGGGGHASASRQLLLQPFALSSGVDVIGVTDSDSPAEPSSRENLDVVQMELRESISACDQGDISLLPLQLLERDTGHTIVEEFVPNTLQPCSIGQVLWSTLPVYNKRAHRGANFPSLISDFFNIVDFPGKRAIAKSPRNLAEWAMAASGVEPALIYEELGTDRAWPLIRRKLSEIEREIVWVKDDQEALLLVEKGEATFAVVQSHTALRRIVGKKADLGMLWDAAIAQVNVFAIPATTQRFSEAWKFLQFATSSERSGNFAARFGYGVSRVSALMAFNPQIRSLLPSFERNRRTIIWGNSSWWRDSGGSLNRLFADWLANSSSRQPKLVITEWHSLQNYFVSEVDRPLIGTN